jgi:hypothetical protein
MCDFGPRPFLESFDLGLDVRSVLFVLPTSSIQGAFRTTDTVFGHPNAANIWNGRFAPEAAARETCRMRIA